MSYIFKFSIVRNRSGNCETNAEGEVIYLMVIFSPSIAIAHQIVPITQFYFLKNIHLPLKKRKNSLCLQVKVYLKADLHKMMGPRQSFNLIYRKHSCVALTHYFDDEC